MTYERKMIEALERQCEILREGLESIRGRVSRRLDPSIWHAADSALLRAGVVKLTQTPAAPLGATPQPRNDPAGYAEPSDTINAPHGAENGASE